MIGYAFYLALAGEARAAAGDVDEGAALVEEAISRNARERGFFFESEIYRLMAMLRMQQTRNVATAEAEQLYRRAIDVAGDQGALLFELRAANALARLWQESGRVAQARTLLDPYPPRLAGDAKGEDFAVTQALLRTLCVSG
ncbi:MAG: hypothetical protein VW644_09185 [Alphaproteobacteria bacterium]